MCSKSKRHEEASLASTYSAWFVVSLLLSLLVADMLGGDPPEARTAVVLSVVAIADTTDVAVVSEIEQQGAETSEIQDIPNSAAVAQSEPEEPGDYPNEPTETTSGFSENVLWKVRFPFDRELTIEEYVAMLDAAGIGFSESGCERTVAATIHRPAYIERYNEMLGKKPPYVSNRWSDVEQMVRIKVASVGRRIDEVSSVTLAVTMHGEWLITEIKWQNP